MKTIFRIFLCYFCINNILIANAIKNKDTTKQYIGSQTFSNGATYDYYISNGQVYLEKFLLKGMDSHSFTFFGNYFYGYYKDKYNIYDVEYDFECGHHHCWLNGIKKIKIIEKENIDIKSFEVLDDKCKLAKDKDHLYKIQKERSPYFENGLVLLESINPNNFMCNYWFVFDYHGNAIYWDYSGDINLHKIHIDFKTMKILSLLYTKDKYHVYARGVIIENADPLSFRMINNNKLYDAMDKNNFYLYGKIIELQ